MMDSVGIMQIIAAVVMLVGLGTILMGRRKHEKKNNHGDDLKHNRAQFSNYERARRRARRNKSNG